MRILHTADWHLGQKFCEKDRKEEHQFFLNWLLQTIRQQKVDALVVAGDIFDVGNPPNYALKQYYDFLRQVIKYCNNIIITGGNHDSANNLNAPKELLQYFKIHVVGGATTNIADEIVEIKNEEGQLIGAVAAVPFLKSGDIRKSVAGETYEERVKQIKLGIQKHYADLAQLMQSYKDNKLPILATGHLYAAGSTTSESEKDIHIGNQGQVEAETFPKIFDYVALGHLHRPQIVNKLNHICYSGSPIPLSFSERKDNKQVVLVEFEEGKVSEVTKIEIPVSRKLIRFTGALAEVKQQLYDFQVNEEELMPWIEIHVSLLVYHTDLNEQLQKIAADKKVKILKIKSTLKNKVRNLAYQLANVQDLNELRPIDVFRKKCESVTVTEAQKEELVNTFSELLGSMEN